MRRLFWMGLGAAATVVAARRARRTLGPYATAAAPVTGALSGLRAGVAQFRTTMAAQEAELRAAFIEDAGKGERRDPRRPAPRSWAAAGHDHHDDDEPYSF